MRFLLPVLCALSLGLASCATVEPDPCSKEWVEWKTKATLQDFAKENRRDINELRKAASWLDGESRLGAMRIAFAVNTAKKLVEEFSEDVVPEVQSFSEQCGQPQTLADLFVELLEDEGVDNRVIEWVEAMSALFPEE